MGVTRILDRVVGWPSAMLTMLLRPDRKEGVFVGGLAILALIIEFLNSQLCINRV